jgi:hypothetical protein
MKKQMIYNSANKSERTVHMKYKIIVLSSVTYALKAQSILAREGIDTRLEKLSRTRTLKGCGYGLRISSVMLDRAVKLLNNERIRIVEIIDY